jgi:hypothetical protein
MAAIEAVDLDEHTGEPIDPPEPWQLHVLQQLLRRMYPDHGYEDALKDALASRDGDGARTLQERLTIASDRQAQLTKLLRNGFTYLERAND